MVDDGRSDDGRTPDHGHPISSPCEPNGSGELITPIQYMLFVAFYQNLCIDVYFISFQWLMS